MSDNYFEEVAISNAATNYPGVDISIVRDYMTGRNPEIKCKECKFKAAPLPDPTYCSKRKQIVRSTGCNYGEKSPSPTPTESAPCPMRNWQSLLKAESQWACAKIGVVETRVLNALNVFWVG